MTDSNPTCLKNHFLIAMPSMADPNFAHSITYICEHNEEGAMGIVVNRPMDLTVGDILSHLHIESYDDNFNDVPVMCGGPVQMERGFVLHRSNPHQWENSQMVHGDICLTSSRDILMAIAHNEGPAESLIALGYAGWSAGQLDEEMAQNAWLSVNADPDIMFATPYEQRWQAAANLLGVDLNLLSDQIGHA
ncbi:YqgE/AlgH family protein [Ketobacter sp.]|uniref:YqgE/AlgH family protein n=1 Tax=Ketobacter sp. TaxID=2083498 RepID=UPI000F2B6239|nr:YqgE/AlgH family protein [Ketobacter sp.]RLT95132.1 MAG: YqgE/AlgH family protein [Ketobacter sp.]